MIALLAALVLGTTPALARDSVPARVTVTVADSAGHPVPGSVVRIDSAAWRPASETGVAVLAGVAPGRHLLEARAVGYTVAAFHVSVDPGDAVSVGMTLHRAPPTTLSNVVVTGTRDTARPPVVMRHDWTEGFTQRRERNSGGTFLDQAQIDRRDAYKMTELLEAVPGVMLKSVPDDFGGYSTQIVMRGTSTVRGETCPISYFVDGHPYAVAPDESIDRIVRPRDVAALEIYPGASQVPPQFKTATSSRCGVIVIWTRSAAR